MSSLRKAMVILISALALLAPASASAGQPDTVDPALMQPTLNATFAPWSCWRTGTGIVCDGQRLLAWVAQENGLVCDGRPVYSTGSDERTLRRFGDANGLALHSKSHVAITETLSLTPDFSGPTLAAAGRLEETFEYGTPGDLATRTDRYTGIDVIVTGPGVGLVLHDVGVKTFDIDDDVLSAHGPHPVVVDADGAFAKICDAFATLGA
jgi:hypothetical protein